jgi:hypothetical protein
MSTRRFASSNLTDIACLEALGYRATPSDRRGGVQFFTFDLTPEEAESILAGPERALCGRFHRGLRDLRRMIDLSDPTRRACR